ncbi:MAG TPA: alpha/beta hydrolase [Steroidobacteraceae bacterium]|nr:alpha/beta hydrolase [Steroidobacteraceae bacterium]
MRLDGASEHITPYDKLAFSDVEAQTFLASGEHRAELTAFFGEREYGELHYLASRAVQASARAGRVLLIPGIMGSQLGFDRPAPLPRDLLWVDPVDIGAGRLRALRMNAAPVRAMGVVLHSYLRLRLHLAANGFDVGCVDYDWRLGIDVLGKQLAQRIEAEPHAYVHLVAHSMGSLVARAALALPARRRVQQIVLLGSPNQGSFAGVQAVRGTYPVVRKLARLDSRSSAETLADEVFNTFPSLYHLLPAQGYTPGIDLFDAEQWPREGPRPRAELLQTARHTLASLAKPTDRFSVVVGTGQATVTGIERVDNDFIYTVTPHGDGTVPIGSARLDGAHNYYVACAHSELTRDPLVANAVSDILKTGATRRLARRWSARNRATGRISDSALRLTHTEKLDLTTLDADARREFMQTLNEPPPLRLRTPRR